MIVILWFSCLHLGSLYPRILKTELSQKRFHIKSVAGYLLNFHIVLGTFEEKWVNHHKNKSTLHSVEISEISSHTFWQKLRESNVFTKEIIKEIEMIWRNIFQQWGYIFFYTEVSQKNLWKKIFREITILCTYSNSKINIPLSKRIKRLC